MNYYESYMLHVKTLGGGGGGGRGQQGWHSGWANVARVRFPDLVSNVGYLFKIKDWKSIVLCEKFCLDIHVVID